MEKITKELSTFNTLWMHKYTYNVCNNNMQCNCGGKTGQNTGDSPEASSRPFINEYKNVRFVQLI